MRSIGHRVNPLIALAFLNVVHVEVFRGAKGGFWSSAKDPASQAFKETWAEFLAYVAHTAEIRFVMASDHWSRTPDLT